MTTKDGVMVNVVESSTWVKDLGDALIALEQHERAAILLILMIVLWRGGQALTAWLYMKGGGDGRRKKSGEFPIDPCSIATKGDISASEKKSEVAHTGIRKELTESEKRSKAATKESEERLTKSIDALGEKVEAQGILIEKQGEQISDMRRDIGELSGFLKAKGGERP